MKSRKELNDNNNLWRAARGLESFGNESLEAKLWQLMKGKVTCFWEKTIKHFDVFLVFVPLFSQVFWREILQRNKFQSLSQQRRARCTDIFQKTTILFLPFFPSENYFWKENRNESNKWANFAFYKKKLDTKKRKWFLCAKKSMRTKLTKNSEWKCLQLFLLQW